MEKTGSTSSDVSSSKQGSKRKSPPLPMAAPWLVIPHDKDAESQVFYNMLEPSNVRFRKSIPELRGKSFYQKNSHQGWLVVLCGDKKFDYTPWNYEDCFLFNPMSMETIKLPCLTDWIPSLELMDCVLTSPPKTSACDGDEYSMVYLLFSGGDLGEGTLVFCHPGEKEWRFLVIGEDIECYTRIESMCYFKEKLYIMCCDDRHLEIEVQHGCKPETLPIRKIKISDNIIRDEEWGLGDTEDKQDINYYVDSCDGIFKIEKVSISRGVPEYNVINMLISKLDFSTMSWVKVASLDDHVLFVNKYTKLSFLTEELGATRGCVYYTQPGEMSFYTYDLQDNSIMLSLPCPDLPKPYFTPNWLMIPTTIWVGEKRGVTEHMLGHKGDGSQVLKSIGSRISSKNDDKRENVEEARPWVLDDDMVRLISNYLNPLDCMHFRTVSKDYRSIIPLVNQRRSCSIKCLEATNLSPWLVFPKDNEGVYNFINPMHNNENYLMRIPALLQGSTIRYSKGGWLLMSKGTITLFFYNPFTKATIKLPDLTPGNTLNYQSGPLLCRGMAFSSLPPSSDCIVFSIVYFPSYPGVLVWISFIKRGDGKWTNDLFDIVYLPPRVTNMKFDVCLNSPVFYNGAFYCLDLNGTLAVCTLENDSLEILSMVPPPNCDFIYSSYLLEFEGKLLSVLLGQYGEWVRVFRLDLAEKVWIEVKHLGRHMLFISNTSCLAKIAPTSRMENKIYFPRLQNEGVLYYSLNSGTYHSLSLENENYCTDYRNSKHNLWCSWIEPNWSESKTTQPNSDWSNI